MLLDIYHLILNQIYRFKNKDYLTTYNRMSFEVITKKLLDSVKDEIQKEENMNIINNDIIKPIVDKVLQQLYPYFIGASMIIAFIVIAVFVILCLNLKICYF